MIVASGAPLAGSMAVGGLGLISVTASPNVQTSDKAFMWGAVALSYGLLRIAPDLTPAEVTPIQSATQLEFDFGAAKSPVTYTRAGEAFIRVATAESKLKVTSGGGVLPRTYAFPKPQFQRFKGDVGLMKDLGDLPDSAPQFFKELKPPVGTPIQRGLTPPSVYGGRGYAEEVLFPEGF